MAIKKKRLTFFIMPAFLCIAAAFAEPQPEVLAPSGTENVDLFTGAFVYSYPIQIPPGRKQLAPGIKLTYNSQNGNGWMGMGWSLVLGEVRRSTKNGIPAYDNTRDTFTFTLGGQGYDLFRTTETGSDTFGSYLSYRPRIESSSFRVRYYSGSQMWRIWGKDGVRHDFVGHHKESVSNEYLSWDLAKSIDPDGNYYEVVVSTLTPSSGSNVSLPGRILYTGNDATSLAPSHEIKFLYDIRPDVSSIYRGGLEEKQGLRLKGIEVFSENQLVRKYQCSYIQNIAGISLLASIQQIGSDSISSLPPTLFFYRQPSNTMGEFQQWNVPDDLWQLNWKVNDEVYGAMIDMNGDGLLDHVYKASSDAFFKVQLSSGTGYLGRSTWTATDDNWQLGLGSSNSTTVSMLDINGDGLSDHVMKIAAEGYFRIFFNTGSGFLAQSTWSATGDSWDLSYVQSGNASVAMLDINGDGLPDHVGKVPSESYFRVRLNSGSGFLSESTWTATGDGWGLGESASGELVVSVFDINGDGLPDHVKKIPSENYFRVHMNLGGSFGSEINWAVAGTADAWSLGNTSLEYSFPLQGLYSSFSSSVGMLDMNGDGLLDHVRKVVSDSNFYVRLNTGSGFSSEWAWEPFGIFDSAALWKMETGVIPGGGVQSDTICGVLDLDGDGLVDHVCKNSPPSFSAVLNRYRPGEQLVRIVAPTGGIIQANYQVSKSSYTLARPVTTIQTLTSYNGIDSTTTFSFSFGGGYIDQSPWNKKEFLGFKTAKRSDADGNYSIFTFYQNENAVDDFNVLRGRMAGVSSYTPSGTLLTHSSNTFQVTSPYADAYAVRPSGNESCVGAKCSGVEFFYDSYGNLTKTKYLGDLAAFGDERSAITDYAYNSTDFLVGFPVHTKMLDSFDNIISEKWFSYDAQAYGNAPLKGHLTRMESWLQGGDNPVITADYDSYGNLTDEYDARWNSSGGTLGNHQKVTYDATLHLFPTVITMAWGSLNFTSSATYDAATGQPLTQTDVNGSSTSYQYDVFKRLAKVVGPNDTSALPSIAFEYAASTYSLPNRVVQRARPVHGSTSTLDTYTFLDGFERVLQVKTPVSSGRQSVSGVVTRNARGLPDRTYLPWVVSFSSSTYESIPSSQPYASSQYDALGRLTVLINADMSSSTQSYDGWTTAVLDENAHLKEFVRDAYGLTTEVREHNSGQTYLTTYAYDSNGYMTGVQNAKGQVTSIAYDTLGRKVALNDPQMGSWSYSYDPDGNLVTQTDSSSSTTTMAYDRLGRLASKTYPGGQAITYSYDNGNYAKGFLNRVTDLAGVHDFTYDRVGNLISKTRSIDGQVYASTSEYDAFGRTVALTTPDGHRVTNVYDGMDLSSIISSSSTYATLSYQGPAGKLSSIKYGNNVISTFTYRASDFILSRLQTASTQTLQDFTYAYDGVKNISGITDAIGSQNQTFIYDDLNRLQSAQGAYGTKSYVYDELGSQMASPERAASFNAYDLSVTYSSHVYTAGNGRWTGGLFSDGQGDASMPEGQGVGGGNGLTVELWARPLALSGGYAVRKSGLFSFPRFNSNGSIDGVMVVNGSSVTVNVATSTVLNAWKHYAMTYDGAVVKIYINGQLCGQQSVSGSLGLGSGSLVVGDGFYGMLDDVFAYSHSTSQAILGAHYSAAPKFVPNQALTPSWVPGGVTTGMIGVGYSVEFQGWDLDGDQIKYRIDWGDGSIQDTNFVPSGTVVQTTHSWTGVGLYNIRVRSVQQDAAMGEWSPAYVVQISTAMGATLESGLSAVSMGVSASSNNIGGFSIAQPLVGKSTTSSNTLELGMTFGFIDLSPLLASGSQGLGGGEPVPPTKPSLNDLLVLAGTTTAQVTQIVDGLNLRPDLEQMDGNGNLRLSNGKWIKYDYENRPVIIITASGDKTEFSYDYAGNRVKKIFNGTVTRFIGDLYEVTGGVATKHIFAGGQEIVQLVSGNPYYLHQDHLGSTSLVTSSSGTVLQSVKYTAFGNAWSVSGGATDKNYTGHRRDNTGLIYARARYYDPEIGRFLTPDTIVQAPYDPQFLNRYTYCRNNPINLIDPSGNETIRDDYGNSLTDYWANDGYHLIFSMASMSNNAYQQMMQEIHQMRTLERDLQRAIVWQNMVREPGLEDISLEVGMNVALIGGLAYRGAIGLTNFAMGSLELGAGRLALGAEGRILLGREAEAAAKVSLSVEGAAGTSFFEGTSYTPKVLKQMRSGIGEFHSFPESVAAFEREGSVRAITGGDGLVREMLEIPGSYQGRNGVFQFLKNPDGTINHRLFLPDDL